MLDEFECAMNNNPVCPHCGTKMEDAWELNLDEGSPEIVECGECLKPYQVVMYVDITYNTEPLTEATP